MRFGTRTGGTPSARSRRSTWRGGLAAGALLLPSVIGTGLDVAAPAVASAATVYYVDPAGSDAARGTSPATAWKTLQRVNKAVLQPGDRVLLRRGATFGGRLHVVADGVATARVTVDAYGTGGLPVITGGSNGACVTISGDHVSVARVRTTGCGYSGVGVFGDHALVDSAVVSNNQVGIQVGRGSTYGRYLRNTVTNNNRMTVLTRGTDCGTAAARRCGDDSGATGFVINGNDNEFGFNRVSGSNAFSYDYGRDGSAFEIYDGNRNVIHDNVSVDNLVLSELGRSANGSAVGNVYRNNTATAFCGAHCTEAGGITLRGSGSQYGPNSSTVIEGNDIRLNGSGSHGVMCHAQCPSSTVVRNNVLGGAHALWMDGSGWTVSGNSYVGPTIVSLNWKVTKYPG